MQKNQFALLKTRRFLPLFITMFLGAFNDNVFKNALVILTTYVIAEKAGLNAQMLVTAAAGIFILPFFLFSATAGQLADSVEKTRIIGWIKIIEAILMAIGAIGFYTQNIWLLLAVLFGMGVHSTFFGPIKFSIIPQHLAKDELIGGNALVGAGTFLSILFGTLIGGLLILHESGVVFISVLTVAVAVAGYASSRFIPPAPSKAKSPIRWNIAKETWNIIGSARKNQDVFLSILGISWFWLVGATYLAQFPVLAQSTFGADETVVTFFLTLFSIGIGIGSLLCNRILKGKISGTYVPFGALGMALFTIILYFSSHNLAPTGELIGIGQFIANPAHWLPLAMLVLIPVSGGIYIVPLYAIMQERSDDAHRSRIIAANNVMNALFMVGSAILTLVLFSIGFKVTDVLLFIGVINIPVAFFIRKIVKRQQARNAAAAAENGGNHAA
ncbi:MAG: MFS transporter [Alphaproteobacteria bacterium]|nr:MFS transporter [Alphaproteobacteria bacterium]